MIVLLVGEYQLEYLYGSEKHFLGLVWVNNLYFTNDFRAIIIPLTRNWDLMGCL